MSKKLAQNPETDFYRLHLSFNCAYFHVLLCILPVAHLAEAECWQGVNWRMAGYIMCMVTTCMAGYIMCKARSG